MKSKVGAGSAASARSKLGAPSAASAQSQKGAGSAARGRRRETEDAASRLAGKRDREGGEVPRLGGRTCPAAGSPRHGLRGGSP